jgi:hypothetical protein
MEESEVEEPDLEITWHEHSPAEWTATVRDYQTHQQWEVHSLEEFTELLQRLVHEAGARHRN